VDFNSGTKGWGNQRDDRVYGQEFDTDTYKVIVGVDSCEFLSGRIGRTSSCRVRGGD
jgi:hypothetical protein